MTETRILLADDHAVLREGLAALIDRQPEMVVVGQAGDGREAVRLCAELTPDVLVLDLSMPELGGLQVITTVRQQAPETRIVVLTMHDNPSYLQAALGAGAVGFVVKELVSREILEAIRAAVAGQIFVRMSMGNEAAARLASSRPSSSRSVPRVELSKRELQVLGLVAYGYTHQEAADALGVGKKSVDSYRARLQQKLGLSRRSDLVRYALEIGILSPTADPIPADEREAT